MNKKQAINDYSASLVVNVLQVQVDLRVPLPRLLYHLLYPRHLVLHGLLTFDSLFQEGQDAVETHVVLDLRSSRDTTTPSSHDGAILVVREISVVQHHQLLDRRIHLPPFALSHLPPQTLPLRMKWPHETDDQAKAVEQRRRHVRLGGDYR